MDNGKMGWSRCSEFLALERDEILRFRDVMLRFALQKGRDGRPAFSVPMRTVVKIRIWYRWTRYRSPHSSRTTDLPHSL